MICKDKRIGKIVIWLWVILLLVPTVKINALVEDDSIRPNVQMLEDEDVNNTLQSLYDYINNMKTDIELLEDLDPVEYIKTYLDTGEGSFTLAQFVSACTSYMLREVKTVLSLVLSIIVIAIICSLLKNLETVFSSGSIAQIAFYTCYALLIVILTRSFMISVDLVKDIVQSVADFVGAILPILVTMLAATGGFTEAATMDPFILGATLIIPRIYLNVIIPIVLGYFVLDFASNISSQHKLTNLCKLAKQLILWMQGMILTVFIGLLTIRGIASSTIDAVTLKTAKFAVDNFIPLVGKAFSDAIASVAGYSLILKNAISSIGLVVIVLMMLYPVIKLLMISFTYKLSASLIEPISDSRITKCVASAGEAILLLMSCVLTVSLIFFILIAIMAASGKYVIGV